MFSFKLVFDKKIKNAKTIVEVLITWYLATKTTKQKLTIVYRDKLNKFLTSLPVSFNHPISIISKTYM